MRKHGMRRGSVMVHVLVTSVVAMIVATGLMRIVMMRYVAVQRVQEGGAGKRLAEGALAAVYRHWGQSGQCTLPPSFSSVASATPCGCIFAGTGPFAGVRVETSNGLSGACLTKVCTELANPTTDVCP